MPAEKWPVLLFLVGSFTSCFGDGPVDVSSLKGFASPGDTIDVLYMEAPLLYKKYGDFMQYLNAYHAGFGFLNRNTGRNLTVEFGAPNGVLGAVFPVLMPPHNPTRLLWVNEAIIILTPFINTTYWHSHVTPVFTMSGAQFVKFACWLPTYDVGTLVYNLFTVNSFANPAQIYLPSLTCVDFCWAGLNAMYNIGATPPGILPNISRDYTNLQATTAPVVVDTTDPAQWTDIMRFYTEWQMPNFPANQTMNETNMVQFFEQLINRTETLLGDTFYYYYNATYYSMNLTQSSQAMTFQYLPTPYAQGPRNPAIGQQGNCPLFAPSPPPPPPPIQRAIEEIEGLSGGSIFLIVLLCTVFVYLVGGTLFNTYKLKKTGLNRIPNVHFWAAFGSLVKEGAEFAYRKIFKRGSPDPYATL